jgi:hypothetical protein
VAVSDEGDDFLMGNFRGLRDPFVIREKFGATCRASYQELTKHEFVASDFTGDEHPSQAVPIRWRPLQITNPDRGVD